MLVGILPTSELIYLEQGSFLYNSAWPRSFRVNNG